MNDEFDIVAVIWEDHISRDGYEIPKNPDTLVEMPTLSVGILLRETSKTILIASDIERYEEKDEATYTVILKNCIIGIQRYGKISIENLRTE